MISVLYHKPLQGAWPGEQTNKQSGPAGQCPTSFVTFPYLPSPQAPSRPKFAEEDEDALRMSDQCEYRQSEEECGFEEEGSGSRGEEREPSVTGEHLA